MKKFITILLLSIVSTCLHAGDKAPVTHVDPAAAAKLVEEKKVTVLDVRTADEFKGGHITDAQNYDFTESEFREQVKALDKSKPYLVHCAAGGRSAKSLKILDELGFEKIYHLDGGLNAWQEAGLPVTK